MDKLSKLKQAKMDLEIENTSFQKKIAKLEKKLQIVDLRKQSYLCNKNKQTPIKRNHSPQRHQ